MSGLGMTSTDISSEARPATTVSVRGLHMRFKGQKADALDGIDCDFRAGTITCLVGPDGAGKTTLLRILAGLLTPTTGSVTIHGYDRQADTEHLRELVGYMPQRFGLYDDLTVQQNIDLQADLLNVIGERRRQVLDRLLELTDLKRFTDRFYGKLSGGMKQKLGLLCALLGNPQVLLLDEPGVGVDPLSRRTLWSLVRELVKEGITVVWSTAYLDEAELCDDVRLMTAGQIIASGPPRAVMDTVKGRCWSISPVETNRRATLQRALQHPSIMDGTLQGKSLRLLLRDNLPPPDLAALGIDDHATWQQVPERLEDAFIRLMGGGPGGESVLAKVTPPVNLAPGVDPEAVIEARELTKHFGDFIATNAVQFKVAKGEIFGLLGPNGAGKSVTFKLECGLLKPSSGQALVMGYDLKASPMQARQHLGYMAQKFSLYRQLTVEQNLEFFSGIYGLSGKAQRHRIDQMVDVFALGPYLHELADMLPLGFKQRLSLACAVIHQPQLLFLDEPTSGVDPVTRREFWTHINGLAERGVTVMVTTHFMDEAEYCDRIALIYRGNVIALGPPDELRARIATAEMQNPSMEDTFIALVQEDDRRRELAS